MRLLSRRQWEKVAQLIHDHHLAFIVEVLGRDAIAPEDYTRLKASGKIRSAKVMKVDAVTAAHVLGAIAKDTSSKHLETMTPKAFWAMAPSLLSELSPTERAAIEYTRDNVGQYIKGLGSKLDIATGHILIEADSTRRKKLLRITRKEVARGIAEKASVQEVARRLREATKDMQRNWTQIAATEMHTALEEGKAAAIMRTMSAGSDPLVFKRPQPDACPFCKLLYLKGGVPRVFHMSELIANGTNVGRKAKRPSTKGPSATEWRPVLGSMHPWCKCTLYHMPAGMKFDSRGRMVYVGVKKSQVCVESLDTALLGHECTSQG